MHVQTDKPTSEARRVARVQYTVQYTRSKMLYTKAILIAFMRSVFVLHNLCIALARVMPPPPRSARWEQTMCETLIIMSYIENQDEATATATIIASNAMNERAVSSLRRSGQRTEQFISGSALCALETRAQPQGSDVRAPQTADAEECSRVCSCTPPQSSVRTPQAQRSRKTVHSVQIPAHTVEGGPLAYALSIQGCSHTIHHTARRESLSRPHSTRGEKSGDVRGVSG